MTDILRREGGTLWTKTTPDGTWLRAADTRAEAVRVLAQLSEDDRKAIFDTFCTACGADNPACVCRRDE